MHDTAALELRTLDGKTFTAKSINIVRTGGTIKVVVTLDDGQNFTVKVEE